MKTKIKIILSFFVFYIEPEIIVGLNNKQLEEWYDKIYNAILSVIIINEHIPAQNNIAEIKPKYNWRT